MNFRTFVRDGRPVVLGVVLLISMGLTGTIQTAEAQDSSDTFTLQAVMEQALDENPDLLQQREAVSQARYNLDQAESQLWPDIQATGEYTRQQEVTLGGQTFTEPNEWQAGVNLSQPLYQAGKLFAEQTRAREQIQAEEFRRDRNEEQILFNVASLYIRLLNAERQIEIARTALDREQRFLDRAQTLLEVGNVTRTAVLQAEVRVAEAERQLEQARNDRALLRDQLALEIGRDTLDGSPASLPGLEPPEEDLDRLIDRAMESRRDLKLFKRQVEATRAGVESEEADFWPSLNLDGNYNVQEESVTAPDGRTWNVGVIATFDLYDGGLRQAQLNAAHSQLDQAQIELERQRRIVRTDVRDARRRIETQRTVLRSLERQHQSAEENYRQVFRQFEEGLVSSLDVVEASTTLQETENRLANGRYQLQLDYLNLEQATGRFFEQRVQALRSGE